LMTFHSLWISRRLSRWLAWHATIQGHQIPISKRPYRMSPKELAELKK
jgi:hypothetical protein